MTQTEGSPANRFNELPIGTQEFLSRLQTEDIKLMSEGLKLVKATQTISKFLKWVILIVLGCLVGATTLYDNVVKVIGWFHGPK